MGFCNAEEVLMALAEAYYEKRDIDATLSCVTEDIEWVGTENNDSAKGKEQLRKLLEADAEEFPESFGIALDEPAIQSYGSDVVMITVNGKQSDVPGVVTGFTIRGTACCVRTEEGWLISNVHTSVPNSEIEKSILQKKLKAEREKQTALLNSVPGGVAIYRVKKDGRIPTDYISDGLARICGYDDGEDIMRIMGEDSRRLVLEEDYPVIAAACWESIQSGVPTNVNYRVHGKDGNPVRITLDSVVMQNAAMGEDDVAVFYAVQALVSDDVIRAKTEQDYYRMILNITRTTYFEIDEKGNCYTSESFAQYKVSEYGVASIISGKNAEKCFHPDDLSQVITYLHGISKDGNGNSVVARMRMRDGTYQWTELIAHVEFNQEHRIKRMTGILRNVNPEWKKQKAALEQALEDARTANQAKTDFLSRVSHDMRTPLNGILGLTTLLKESITSEEVRNDLQQLELSGHYLLNLINDTLDVSKIESGKMELHPVVCDGRSVFDNVISLAKPNLEAKNIQLRVQAEDLPFTALFIDVGRVEQVLMNIIGNAVKFTPEGGTIDLIMTNLSVKNGVITDKIVIADNGIGMSQEFLPNLFEPFSQENPGKTNSFQGTGLGMTITRQLIELMGGEIQVESELGKGTIFTLVLPMPIATEAQIETCKNHKVSEVNDHTLKGRRVLLCEDHPLNATIATRLLNKKEILVEHAENGKTGVEMYRNSPPHYYDIILMDIRMPVMDGIEATRRIRTLDRIDARKIPIVAMTANAFDEDVEEARAAGMDEHLSKPIESEKLFETIEKMLELEHDFRRQMILVVDDVAANRAVIRETLRAEYDIIEAADGKEALEILETKKGVNAVITDIQMPGMDGMELIKRIRANVNYKHIAIIANTQFGDPEQEESLLSAGANDFVYKPTTPKIVEIRVKNVLRRL